MVLEPEQISDPMVTKKSTKTAAPHVATGVSSQVIPKSEITDLTLETEVQQDPTKESGGQVSGLPEVTGVTPSVQEEALLHTPDEVLRWEPRNLSLHLLKKLGDLHHLKKFLRPRSRSFRVFLELQAFHFLRREIR